MSYILPIMGFCVNILMSSFHGRDDPDETIRDLYRQGMSAFGGIAPTYHIAPMDKPTIEQLTPELAR